MNRAFAELLTAHTPGEMGAGWLNVSLVVSAAVDKSSIVMSNNVPVV